MRVKVVTDLCVMEGDDTEGELTVSALMPGATVEDVLALRTGDAHIIRNAGGLATDDALRSLVISQQLLGTEEVIVVEHTGCGMLTFHDPDGRGVIFVSWVYGRDAQPSDAGHRGPPGS